uniref:cysteine desulfurase family protein n=1 Tax=Conyzicola sp. TaxID=1969404 RepID=UPI00398A318A
MPIYLDHAATSPMPPEVIAAYASALAVVGNPSSIHSQGQNAKRMLEEAREQVAASVGADSVEVTFTGGGTEAVNLGIKGLWWARVSTGSTRIRPRILVPMGEHHATIDAIEWLEKHEGAVIEWIPIDALGRIDLVALESALGDDVALVTVLSANNEVGTLQPVAEIAALAARYGVPVHVDAIAEYGYVPIDFHALGVAALSISAHKIGGPVGVGALVIARSTTIVPLLHGGNQQRARSGTQDVAGAVRVEPAVLAPRVAAPVARPPHGRGELPAERPHVGEVLRNAVAGDRERGVALEGKADLVPGDQVAGEHRLAGRVRWDPLGVDAHPVRQNLIV